MNVDFQRVLQKAEEYKVDMAGFLRDMIAIPSESCHERRIVERIKEEMKKANFDNIEIDKMGNILGTIGHGKHVIAMDAHIDTVGIGEENLWQYDPYRGYEDEDIIIGRGGSGQKGGMASMVYAGKMIKELELEDDYTLIITGTVQKEECAGLCWQYMINEDKIQPEFVVITEPTSCNIYRGHRGRMEIKVIAEGCKMGSIINDLNCLNEKLQYDEFLGGGSITVSGMPGISTLSGDMKDCCTISIDRRLTNGETYQDALEEIRNLPSVKGTIAQVSICDYEKSSYKGVVYPTAAYFEAWVIEEEHPVCKTLVEGYKILFNEEPLFDKWAISTNAASIMGRYDIPCIGFGPGHEAEVHSTNERTWKSELVKATAMYAVIPSLYVSRLKNR
ncbi:YgeY family selenium metabolism-linked hydrolase [Clostridium sp.]|uniref:YgeY family selenium metabolism-linked hydrolase n=1 Tax=Clostridium sp. TaxID=1506 RepID=UPI001A3A8CD5|nr:YgeY family selenium metabolism-linked hydrolase [Clostridium sp.]MBK5240284.1 YgeY family selenium metabolism-linked hydrolase [Clostridium sp.]